MTKVCDNAIFGVNQADVAQLDRAFGYEPKGSRFESWHPQKKGVREKLSAFLFYRMHNQKGRKTGAFVSKWASPFARGCATIGFFILIWRHSVYMPSSFESSARRTKESDGLAGKTRLFFFFGKSPTAPETLSPYFGAGESGPVVSPSRAILRGGERVYFFFRNFFSFVFIYSSLVLHPQKGEGLNWEFFF